MAAGLSNLEVKSDGPLGAQKKKSVDVKNKDISKGDATELINEDVKLGMPKKMFSDMSDILRQRQLIENVDDICASSENDDFDKYLADRRFGPITRTNPEQQQEPPEESKNTG